MQPRDSDSLAPDSLAPDAVPAAYAEPAREVALRIEDFADRETLASLGIADPYDLSGLYQGVPLPQKSVSAQPQQPDEIFLFRRPILEEWIERGNVTLQELVTHVLVHEIAHHFGWSDDDIARIDRWWE